ncbi:MAG: DMT family transporter [Pseudomonadota bacterium]
MAIRKATPVDLTLLIVTMAFWGLAVVAMKIVAPETGPFWLTVGRAALGLVVVLPIALMRGLHWPRGLKEWRLVIAISLLVFSIPITLIGWATLTIDAGVATLLMGGSPFFAVIVGHFVTSDEPLTPTKFIGVLMGFCGILSIIGVDVVLSVGTANLLSQLAILGGSMCYVTSGFLVRRSSMPPLSLSCWTLFLSTALLVPVSYVMSGPVPTDLNPNTLIWLLFAGLVATGLAFISRFHLIQTIGYSMFAIGVNFIPVFGVLFGALILGEVITPRIALALALVMGGLFIARMGTKSGPESAKAS